MKLTGAAILVSRGMKVLQAARSLSLTLAALENVVDREQQDEFYAVRESAYDALRLGTPIDRHRSVPMCQFWNPLAF